MPNFLFEIYLEEVPHSILPISAEFIQKKLPKLLFEETLTYQEIEYFTSPRRFAFLIKDLPKFGLDKILEQKGPSIKNAYNDDKTPSIALQGFLKSHNVSLKDIIEKDIKEQLYIFIQKLVQGQQIIDILPRILKKLINSIQFPQPMRWNYNNETFEFIRPIRGITALLDQEILDISFFGLKATREIYGHRQFFPKPITLKSSDEYEICLTENGCIPRYNQRKKRIHHKAQELANSINGTLLLDEELLNDLCSLTEWPHCILANFDEKYLSLPKEVLISEMRIHQKYIPLVDNQLNLLPYYIITTNIPINDENTKNNILKGNNKVLLSRFSDGQFFYSEDLKKGLDFYKNALSSISFVESAGSMKDKVDRIQFIAGYLSKMFSSTLNHEDIINASQYSKADIASLMVGEFPELQGVIGSYYAPYNNLNSTVSLAIREHYYPLNYEGQILNPTQELSAIIGLADRIDNLCTLYAIGKTVTGSRDPYALRRQTIAMINILIQYQWENFSINSLLDHIAPLYQDMLDQNKDHIFNNKIINNSGIFNSTNSEILQKWKFLLKDFIKTRLEGMLKVHPFNLQQDTLNSSLTQINFILNDIEKVSILQEVRIKNQEKFALLIELFKRIKNIIKDQKILEFKESLLQEEAEKKLYKKYLDIIDIIDNLSYKDKLSELVNIEEVLTAFFNKIMVKTKDEKEKNRLALLNNIYQLFMNQADFSKLS